MLYQINNATVQYGADVILDNIQFEIRDKKEKIAVVDHQSGFRTFSFNQFKPIQNRLERKLFRAYSGSNRNLLIHPIICVRKIPEPLPRITLA